MKKKLNILIGLMAITVLLMGIIMFTIPRFSGLVNNGSLSGTFVKAEKYKKQALTEKDLLLRTELSEDTVNLKNFISSLAVMHRYNTTVISQIDSVLLLLRGQPPMTNTKYSGHFIALKNYGDWLWRSDTSLIRLATLMDQLILDQANVDPSIDIENEVLGFSRFLSALSSRDTALVCAANGIDRYINETGKANLSGESLSALQGIRDQLLADYFLTALILGDKVNYERLYKGLAPSQLKEEDKGISKKYGDIAFKVFLPVESGIKLFGNGTHGRFLNGYIGSLPEPSAMGELNEWIELQAVGGLNRIEPQAFGGLNRIEPQAFGGLNVRIEPQ